MLIDDEFAYLIKYPHGVRTRVAVGILDTTHIYIYTVRETYTYTLRKIDRKSTYMMQSSDTLVLQFNVVSDTESCTSVHACVAMLLQR